MMPNRVAIAMFGWIPVVLVLFARLPHRRAAAIAIVTAWLFLPEFVYPIAGLPDYSKTAATCAVPLVAICLFDVRKLLALRPKWADAPILLFCLSPLASSLQNGRGFHDALSAVFAQSLSWGVPYAIGRLYLNDLAGLRELSLIMVAGGVAYVPLCLFELWKGPVLREQVYNYPATGLVPVLSFGVVRPPVFMQTSLMVALWMAAVTMVAIWLWKTGAVSSIRGLSFGWVVAVMILTVILIRSVNGWVAVMLGSGLLITTVRWRTRTPVICVMVLIVSHIALRATGLWSGDQVVYVAKTLLNAEKGRSVGFRFLNEDVIAANARQHPLLGFGRQVTPFIDPKTHQFAVPDSLWISIFACYGVVGLIGMTTTLLSPVVLFMRRMPVEEWGDAIVGPSAALAIVLVLYMTDHLANAMVNPIFMLVAGGLSGLPAKAARNVPGEAARVHVGIS